MVDLGNSQILKLMVESEYRKAMTLTKQPKSMVVVGSGAIGSEFAYFYNSIGTKVTLVEYLPNILPLEDIDISKQLEKTFKKSGINVLTSTEVKGVSTNSKGCKVTLSSDDKDSTIDCDIVLSAVGVETNIQNIIQELELLPRKEKSMLMIIIKLILWNYAIGDIIKGPALARSC